MTAMYVMDSTKVNSKRVTAITPSRSGAENMKTRLKDSNKNYKVVWCIVARAPPYKSGSGRYALCLTEKSVIVRASPKGLLNKRTELISKCRHRSKHLLCNISSPSILLSNVHNELHVSSLTSGNTKL